MTEAQPSRPCKFVDPVTEVACDRPHCARDLCDGHYTQWKKGQGLRPLRLRYLGCKFVDSVTEVVCDRRHKAYGMCDVHYDQWRKGQSLRPVGSYVRPRQVSLCHPDRNHDALGMCSPCYCRWRLYGLTWDDVQRMWARQDGACPCGDPIDLDDEPSWHVDHCHDSGRARDLMHPPCNKSFGAMKESASRLLGLANYARRLRESDLEAVA